MSSARPSSSRLETANRIDTDHFHQQTVERNSKQPRRRHIDPTTCERDYTIQEREFMLAMDEYKRASGRMFPTCSEILEVIRNLGYSQCDATSSAFSANHTKDGLLVG